MPNLQRFLPNTNLTHLTEKFCLVPSRDDVPSHNVHEGLCGWYKNAREIKGCHENVLIQSLKRVDGPGQLSLYPFYDLPHPGLIQRLAIKGI